MLVLFNLRRRSHLQAAYVEIALKCGRDILAHSYEREREKECVSIRIKVVLREHSSSDNYYVPAECARK